MNEVFYILHDIYFFSYKVGYQKTPSAPGPAPMSDFRTHCGPWVKKFANPQQQSFPTNSVPKLFFNYLCTPGIWPYIQEIRDSVCDLESRLQRTKANVEEMKSCMRSWAMPVFDRKDGRKDALLSFEDRDERLGKFYGLIRSSGEKIHFLLKVGKKRVWVLHTWN